MSGGEPAVALRPAREDDRDFFARVYASTRTEELAVVPWSDEQRSAFLAQQFAAQTADYAANYADASFDVVLVDGEPAGRLIVYRRLDEIHIVDIALLPEWRGRGIGTRLLEALQEEAKTAGKPLGIHVEVDNPARSLYDRLGFRQVEERGLYLLMRWVPEVENPRDGG
ncbi:MAG: hypothetical protein QOE36_1653 [Gaiellaceae bacterium]|nr:hypothetical protein [Gaiellaceae bacterium]